MFDFFHNFAGIRAHNLRASGSLSQISSKTLQVFSTIKYAQWPISILIVQRGEHIQAQAQTVV